MQETLDSDDKPALTGNCLGYTGASEFKQWYDKSTPAMTKPVKFAYNANTQMYVYDSSFFFPLTGFGCQDTEVHGASAGKNFYFTTEIAVVFQYKGGEVFNFRGDDDVWVFINKKLVVDLGGVHSAQEGSVTLDDQLLTRGKNYELKIFHAERQCCESNFKAETSILLEDDNVCPNQCSVGSSQGVCNINTGKCKCCIGFGGADCATPGGVPPTDSNDSRDTLASALAYYNGDQYCWNSNVTADGGVDGGGGNSGDGDDSFTKMCARTTTSTTSTSTVPTCPNGGDMMYFAAHVAGHKLKTVHVEEKLVIRFYTKSAVDSVEACARHCLGTTNCLSFAYRARGTPASDANVCQLNGYSGAEAEHLQSSTNWDLHRRLDECRVTTITVTTIATTTTTTTATTVTTVTTQTTTTTGTTQTTTTTTTATTATTTTTVTTATTTTTTVTATTTKTTTTTSITTATTTTTVTATTKTITTTVTGTTTTTVTTTTTATLTTATSTTTNKTASTSTTTTGTTTTAGTTTTVDPLGGIICDGDGNCDDGGVDRTTTSSPRRLSWNTGTGEPPVVPENAWVGYFVTTVPAPFFAAAAADVKGSGIGIAVSFNMRPATATATIARGRLARRDESLAAHPFAVNTSTGEILIAGPLDYETKSSYDLLIEVAAGGTGGVATFNKTVAVLVNIVPVACLRGTWSATGTYPCATHTKCTAGQEEIRMPSARADRTCASSDAEASDKDEDNSSSLSVGLAALLAVLLVVLLAAGFMYRKSNRDDDSKESPENGTQMHAHGLQNGGINPRFENTDAFYATADNKAENHEYMDSANNTCEMAATPQTYDIAATTQQGEQTYDMAAGVGATSTGNDAVYGLASQDALYDTPNNAAGGAGSRQVSILYDTAGGESTDAVYETAANTSLPTITDVNMDQATIGQDTAAVYDIGTASHSGDVTHDTAVYDIGTASPAQPQAATSQCDVAESANDPQTPAQYDVAVTATVAPVASYDIAEGFDEPAMLATAPIAFEEDELDLDAATDDYIDSGYSGANADDEAPALPTKAKYMGVDQEAMPIEIEEDDESGDVPEGYLGVLANTLARTSTSTSNSSFEDNSSNFVLEADNSLRLKSVHRGNPLFCNSVVGMPGTEAM